MKPQRIQRKRTKGWKMPPNTIYVGRPTKWGNPFIVGMIIGGKQIDHEESVKLYAKWLEINVSGNARKKWARKELRGKNLACFCPLDKPCHADVLLRIANEN